MSLESFTMDVQGVAARCWAGGSGRPLMLLHGSGPGAASQGTWRHVIDALTARYRVYMTDLIGFGESGRKTEAPFFDLDLWLAQAEALLDRIPEQEVGLVGHSISGTTALRLAGRSPRITRLMTTATMGWNYLETPYTALCWTFPETREDLRRTLKALMYDHDGITDELLDYRMGILHDGVYGPHFSAMFEGEKQRFIEAAALSPAELAKVTCEVMMVHGMNDVMFPAEGTTIPMSRHLPQADLLLLARCGHLPALEHPDKLLNAMLGFFR
ncbi:alpha/beta hydrolase [Zavarzinia compransoris]|uniref:alpha/beta fold hydrolase n=1 Tax=Zavarzinia marina TaxID=2911065 RepID=UPI001F355006|nr:alpha/beta hydrolase [Zavarzinia marina]MCF4167356.1 alpha/beta hydrolase [Zavarzinia marina]